MAGIDTNWQRATLGDGSGFNWLINGIGVPGTSVMRKRSWPQRRPASRLLLRLSGWLARSHRRGGFPTNSGQAGVGIVESTGIGPSTPAKVTAYFGSTILSSTGPFAWAAGNLLVIGNALEALDL
jgi:hypothetical protein